MSSHSGVFSSQATNIKTKAVLLSLITLALALCTAHPLTANADDSTACQGSFAIGANAYAGSKYLVTFDPAEALDTGAVQYQNTPMFWSEKYGYWCTLVDSQVTLQATDFTYNESATKQSISYDGDINKSGKVNIIDTQTAYDLACGNVYSDYSKLSMEQWLSADFNADGAIDAPDAFAIQVYVHTKVYDENQTEGTLLTSMHITESGTYRIQPKTTGTITIDSELTVTLIGQGTDTAFNELYLDCGEGIDLTLKDLFISNQEDVNLINFTGQGNTLRAAGTNVLEAMIYVASAAIHVGPDTSLTFDKSTDPEGKLYLYKYTQGSGIGGNGGGLNTDNAGEANGAITFNGGTWFIKGSKTGAVIGNDTCGDTEKEAKIGDITINGGTLYIEANAKGAAIGGSNLSGAGDVYVNGGNINIYNDYAGSAIGAGGSAKTTEGKNGNLIISGGSLKTYLTRNGAAAWGYEYGKNDVTLTATKTNADEQTVYVYRLDVSAYTAPYTVEVDGKEYYSGGAHAYTYTPNTESTMANWSESNEDNDLYLYLTEGEHTVSVNGGDDQTITVEQTVYSEEETPEIPEENWADHANTSWYNDTDTEFTLTTAEELAGLAKLVDEGTDSFTGKTIKLAQDLDLSAYEWEPIGSSGSSDPTTLRDNTYAFHGIFDGQNHEISGLYYYKYTPNSNSDDFFDDNRGGLFAYAYGATIQNVVMKSGYVACSAFIAAIVGYGPNCKFINCENYLEINPLQKPYKGGYNYGYYGAGICGYGGIYFENCKNYGDVLGYQGCGGICAVTGTNCTIKRCENYGKITSQGDGTAGGIINSILYGSTTLTIENCLNAGDVVSQISSAGGICGEFVPSAVTTNITGCVNTGNISGRSAGGIIGKSALSFQLDEGVYPINHYPLLIANCYNTGDIESHMGYRYAGGAGGIIGELVCNSYDIFITNCYSTGTITCAANENAKGEKFSNGILTNFGFRDPSDHRYPAILDNSKRLSLQSCVYSSDTYAKTAGHKVYFNYLVCSNNFYLKGSAFGGISGDDFTGEVEPKTADELKNLTDTLGSAYTTDTGINGGYPVLKWQLGLEDNSTYSFVINTEASNAIIQVMNSKGETITPVDGVYTVPSNEVCMYWVNTEGYLTSAGFATKKEGIQTINVSPEVNNLEHTLTIDSDVDNAVVSLKKYRTALGDNGWQSAYGDRTEDGGYTIYSYISYRYTIKAEGYDDIEGEFTCNGEDVVITANFTQ